MADGRIEKDEQFNGFRQVWTQRPDGVFDGPYTVYWDSGPILCMRGQYHAGAQHGIWTHWERTGHIKQQILFHNDEPIETRTGPPWLDEAAAHHTGGPPHGSPTPDPE
jgi:hypothetical protein